MTQSSRRVSVALSVLAPLLLSMLMAGRVGAQDVKSGVHRTPHKRFANLDGFPFEPHYIEIDGLRVHYVDEGPGSAGTMLLLHGEPTWSYLYRGLIPVFTAAGYRVVAPDMIGFGRSDKVLDREWYTLDHHVVTLKELVTRLDLRNITVVVQDWAGPNGLITATELPDRFYRLILLNTWLHHDGIEYTQSLWRWNVSSQSLDFTELREFGLLIQSGYRAPFDSQHATAGALRWPWMLPFAQPEAGNARRQAAAFDALASWDKPAHVTFGDSDSIFTVDWGRKFAAHIPGATFDTVEGAGHFVTETGAPLAELILRRISEE
jgi:haloalkane dehalogenase